MALEFVKLSSGKSVYAEEQLQSFLGGTVCIIRFISFDRYFIRAQNHINHAESIIFSL